MVTLILNSLAAVLYLLAGGVMARRLLRGRAPHSRGLTSLVALTLLLHGLGVIGSVTVQTGVIELGFLRASSLLFWVINLLVLLSSLRKPLYNLFILLLPLTALSLSLGLLVPGTSRPLVLNYELASHVLLSMLAYSLFTIATLQALVLAWQNHQLKHHHPLGRVRLLPPLQTMEALLFELLWAGQILLSLSILSGFIFVEDLFAQHLLHKTVFSLAAWVIYALLLWGRHRLGWRGYTAIRWALSGFVLLMLAYFGSKLVLELILGRY